MCNTIPALSIHQPWANLIATGKKTLETRPRRIHYRGPLAICSTKRSIEEPRGCVIAIVQVVDCRPFTPQDAAAACCPWRPSAWAWVLADVQQVDPSPVRGQQGIFRIPWPLPS